MRKITNFCGEKKICLVIRILESPKKLYVYSPKITVSTCVKVDLVLFYICISAVIENPQLLKTYIFNLVHTARFWNNLRQASASGTPIVNEWGSQII